MATPTGFEPVISALTGQCVRPLHHGASYKLSKNYILLDTYNLQVRYIFSGMLVYPNLFI